MKSTHYDPPFTVPIESYRRQIRQLVRCGLAEDIGRGDRTTRLLKLGNRKGRARLTAKQGGLLAGGDAFEATFRALDAKMQFDWREIDGSKFRHGSTIVTLAGRVDAILTGERTAINFLAHLSGIATTTRRLVEKIPNNTARLLDTRKTTPGWRFLEKHATAMAGAVNHRISLHDAIMIKDNHIAACGSVKVAIARMTGRRRTIPVICEVRNLAEIREALDNKVEWLLCDNFTPSRLRAAVRSIRDSDKRTRRRTIIETSGNVSARTIAALGRTGVDFISSGAITHSAPSIDFSLEWVT